MQEELVTKKKEEELVTAHFFLVLWCLLFQGCHAWTGHLSSRLKKPKYCSTDIIADQRSHGFGLELSEIWVKQHTRKALSWLGPTDFSQCQWRLGNRLIICSRALLIINDILKHIYRRIDAWKYPARLEAHEHLSLQNLKHQQRPHADWLCCYIIRGQNEPATQILAP